MSLSAFIAGTVVPERRAPVAVAEANPFVSVIGSVIRVSGQRSYDPSELPGRAGDDALTVAGSNVVGAPSGSFTSVDLGRSIELVGVDAGKYLIASIVGPSSVSVIQADGGTVSFVGGSNSWSVTDRLTYAWSFKKIPIGSRVAQEGFRILEEDGSLVSFSPDIVGEYQVSLQVSNASFSSEVATTAASVRALLVPNARGIVPDGKFIWQYIRDVWQHVEGKELFETLWSALIQLVGAELLKLYQNDFNKSIRDIQDLYQRRWLSYEPALKLDQAALTMFLGNHLAGLGGTTRNIGESGQLVILPSAELVVVEGSVLANVYGLELDITYDPRAPENVRKYRLQGNNLSRTGYLLTKTSEFAPPNPQNDILGTNLAFEFDFQSKSWVLSDGSPGSDLAMEMSQSGSPIDPILQTYSGSGSGALDIRAGDVLHFPSGPNAGFYRVASRLGSTYEVDRAPPRESVDYGEAGAVGATAYRPVGFRLHAPSSETSDSFAIPAESGSGLEGLAPGRVIVLGDQTFTVLRSVFDSMQTQEMVIVTADRSSVLTNLDGLPWRAPHTLCSSTQNFEELGVSEGDLLWLEIHNSNTNKVGVVPAQVVGVDRNRLGFVLSFEEVRDGEIPEIPADVYFSLSTEFGISGVSANNGGLVLSGAAKSLVDTLRSGVFQKSFVNTEITTEHEFKAMGGVFRVIPKSIIRNSRIPVDPSVRSIPVLQDWIVQPTVIQEGENVFQVRGDQKYKIQNRPLSLIENSDFILDGEEVFDGEMTFDTGTDIVYAEDGRFTERSLRVGDSFQIIEPLGVSGAYTIKKALSSEKLLLTSTLPEQGRVTARVRITRARGGTFLRFIPGGFTAKKRAPNRFWAEVTFFDNAENIENNFGILVNLRRKDLDDISSDLNYRQAVTGLMFAYTHGPIINKIRLGAQILLGLPFAEHRGIVRSIDPDYRLDANGIPVQGRITVEDTDQAWKPLGVMRVYTFPVDANSDLAGLDTNPGTGNPYAVGDRVERLAPLSKGVEVNDYQTSPLELGRSARELLQQFHTVRLRANDSIFSIDELTLLSGFLKNITPSSVAMAITVLSESADAVSVTDRVGARVGSNGSALVDNPYFRLPSALMFDGKTMSGLSTMITEEGFVWVRCSGHGLATVLGDTTVEVSHNGLARAGDKLVIVSGPNQGTYPILGVFGDELSLSETPTSGLQPALQDFYVYRVLQAEIRRGSYTAASGEATTEPGLLLDGVSPGDLFITEAGGCFVIKTVLDAVVTVSGSLPDSSGAGYRIIRKPLIESPSTQDWGITNIESSGVKYLSLSNQYTAALLEVGDELELVSDTPVRIEARDPKNLVFIPVLPAGTYAMRLCKKGHLPSQLSPDTLEVQGPEESLELSLRESQSLAACQAGAALVLLAMERTTNDANPARPSEPLPADIDTRPGDFLVLTSGGNSMVDVGYGAGVYPILSVGVSEVTLTVPLTSDDDAAWKILRRR